MLDCLKNMWGIGPFQVFLDVSQFVQPRFMYAISLIKYFNDLLRSRKGTPFLVPIPLWWQSISLESKWWQSLPLDAICLTADRLVDQPRVCGHLSTATTKACLGCEHQDFGGIAKLKNLLFLLFLEEPQANSLKFVIFPISGRT